MDEKKSKRLPTWAIVVITILVLAVIGGSISSQSDTDSNDSQEQTGTTESQEQTDTNKTQEDLVLEDGHAGRLDEYGFAYYIDGYIKNNTDKNYNYVQVDFTVYDSEGNTIGSCLDNNSGLEANGRWKFSAICTGDVENIASYKLNEISKW